MRSPPLSGLVVRGEVDALQVPRLVEAGLEARRLRLAVNGEAAQSRRAQRVADLRLGMVTLQMPADDALAAGGDDVDSRLDEHAGVRLGRAAAAPHDQRA